MRTSSYVAWDPDRHEVVALDQVAITEQDGQIEVVSTHRHLRSGIPEHQARYRFDADWTPRSLVVATGGAWCYQVRFRDHETVTVARVSDGPCVRTVVERRPIPRNAAVFLLNVGLYFPQCVLAQVARTELESTREYDLVPEGTCTVFLTPPHPGTGTRTFRIDVSTPHSRDALTGIATAEGDLIEYRTAAARLVVRRNQEVDAC